MNVLNWGILGTGNIARKFAQDVMTSPSHKIVAVGSRSTASAEKFASELKIPRAHGSYEGLLANPDVQCIYISLPNSLHKEWTIRCAQAKKHILCEKPLAVNRREAEEMVGAAIANDVFLMEAFMYRCHPQTFKIRELIQKGTIGEVRLIHGHFSYNMGRKFDNVRFSNPLAGGGIMDVGCYPVSMARWAAGCEPVECKATANIGMVSRVDELAAISLRFPNGAVASLSCGMIAAADNTVSIYGSEGSIFLPVSWAYRGNACKLVVKTKSGVEEIPTDTSVVPYAVEANHVAQHIPSRQAPAMTWADSIGNMAALDALRASIGLVFDCERGK